MLIQLIDFIKDTEKDIGVQELVMQMYDFFIEHPYYNMMDYEPITNGLRAYYEVVQ